MHLLRRLACAAALLVLVWQPVVAGQAAPPDSEFRILLTNDDGYDSPGLHALAEALAPVARIVVAAPAKEESGTSGSITYRDPIFVRRVNIGLEVEAYAISAKPATCARVGLEVLVDGLPDLVISGINSGPNLGIVSFASGTVGAARQAALVGVPSIAVSRGRPADYKAIAAFVRELVEVLRAEGSLEPGLFLNVNYPAGETRGVRVVRQSMAPDSENYQRRENPRGQVYYWSGWRLPEDSSEETDVGAFAKGFITITPMRVDQTDDSRLAPLRGLNQKLAGAAGQAASVSQR